MSNSLQPHGLQHARLPCPSPSLGACSNSCSLSQWCHPTISSSVTLFSSCSQSCPASRAFPVSWLFESSGQSIGASTSASVLPMCARFLKILFWECQTSVLLTWHWQELVTWTPLGEGKPGNIILVWINSQWKYCWTEGHLCHTYYPFICLVSVSVC